MRLTMKEAKEILESRGFTIKSTGPDDMNPDIYYQREWMGYLYEFHAYIHKSIPSLGIDDETEEVHFSDSDADMHLMRILEGLTSHQTISEEQMRRVRAENVRKYFKERKINAAIAKIPGPDDLAPVNPSAGYEDLSFPTPPSIERLME